MNFSNYLIVAAAVLALSGCQTTTSGKDAGRPILVQDLAVNSRQAWRYDFKDPGFAGIMVRANQQSMDIKISIARALASETSLRLAMSYLKPTVDGVLQYQSTTVGTSKDSQGASANLNFSWSADVWKGKQSAIDAARAELRAGDLDVETARAVLATELARSWLELVSTNDNLNRVSQRITMEEEGIRLARIRVASGLSGHDDIVQRGILLERAVDERLANEEHKKSLRLHILSLGGLDPSEHVDAPERLKELASYGEFEYSTEKLEARPDVRAAAARLEAADARRLAEIRSSYPRIVFNLDSQGSGASLINLIRNPGFGLVSGFRIEGAVFDQGRARARIDRSTAEAIEAEAMYFKTSRSAELALIAALGRYASAQARLLPSSSAVNFALEHLAIVNSRYRQGMASRLEQIDAEKALLTAETAESQVRKDLLSAGIDIEASVTGGMATSIGRLEN